MTALSDIKVGDMFRLSERGRIVYRKVNDDTAERVRGGARKILWTEEPVWPVPAAKEITIEPPPVLYERTLYRRAKVQVRDYRAVNPSKPKPFVANFAHIKSGRWTYSHRQYLTEAAAIKDAEKWMEEKEAQP
jgi:hypothetical protein